MNDHRKYDATFLSFFLFWFVFLALTSNEHVMHFVIGLHLLRSDEMIAMKNENQNLLEVSCEWFMRDDFI